MSKVYFIAPDGGVVTSDKCLDTRDYIDVTGLDPIVLHTALELISRSVVGVSKYGTTLADNNADDFLQHAKEEALDLANYLTKLQSQK
jgi:hypothetical protein